MASMELSSSTCAEIGVPLDLRWLSQGLSGVETDSSPVLFDGEWGIAVDSIQASRVSSRVDLGYKEQFHVSLVTSVSF